MALLAAPALADHSSGSEHYIRYDVQGLINTSTGIVIDGINVDAGGVDTQVRDDLAAIGIVEGAPFGMSQIVDENEPGDVVMDCVTPIGNAVFYPTNTSVGLQMRVGDLYAYGFEGGNGVGVSNDTVFSIFTIDAFTLNSSSGKTNISWLVTDNTPESAPCAADGKGAGYFGLSLLGNSSGNVMSSTDLPLPGSLPDITAWPSGTLGSNTIALDLVDLNSGKTVTLNAEALSLTATRIPMAPVPALPAPALLMLGAGLLVVGGARVRALGRHGKR